jgi:hypothetical protein
MKQFGRIENKETKKNLNVFSFILPLAILILVVMGCDTGPATISSLTISTDKEGKSETKTFKPDQTIYVKVDISNNFENTKLKSSLIAREDILNLKKGDLFPGTDSTENFSSDSDFLTVEYSHPDGFPPGKYEVYTELQDKDGKKIASKSLDITIEKSDSSETKSNYGPGE